MSDIPDHDKKNVLPQLIDEDSDNDLQYLRTQSTNFIDKDLENTQVYYYSLAQDKSNSNSDILEKMDKLEF